MSPLHDYRDVREHMAPRSGHTDLMNPSGCRQSASGLVRNDKATVSLVEYVIGVA